MTKLNITHKKPSRLLTPASGFLKGYSHSLNPYIGCSFACSYCYVRQMPVNLFRDGEWGTWVEVKEESAEMLRKELTREKKKQNVRIFMSSSTDPYQAAEARERITRMLLEVLTEDPPDFLLIQTRSPLVLRDIDLVKKLENRVKVSVSIETDEESVRKAITPQAPPISGRLKAIQTLQQHNIPVQIAVSPLLPHSSRFPALLGEIGERVVVDDYFLGDGSGGRRTKKLKIPELYHKHGYGEWYSPERLSHFRKQLEKQVKKSRIFVSQEGFLP
ncbi:SPL family radical SAM protein [Bacillus sp. FJAT-44742]|uniref:SPL family radical SAM protein n=1 Tax=Bacillus sp. FJAT-44742 TaxID=2014005 RepID=UPI000C24A2E3|nr:radical SAM protein [Bacillus sp. FJAT-44742]